MTTTLTKTQVLEGCINAFKDARSKVADALEMLWAVFETKAWEGSYNSWSEFLEDGLQIARSTGSQYLSIYDNYVKHGGLTVKQLREADMAKLYLAARTGGTPDEQYQRAITLSREELKSEASVKADGSEHECEPLIICKQCGRRMG